MFVDLLVGTASNKLFVQAPCGLLEVSSELHTESQRKPWDCEPVYLYAAADPYFIS